MQDTKFQAPVLESFTGLVSVSPGGESFPLTSPKDYITELKRLKRLTAKNR